MTLLTTFVLHFCAGYGAADLTYRAAIATRRRLLDVKPSKPMLEGDPDWTPWRTWTDWRNAWRYRQLGYRFDRSVRFGAGAWRNHRLERAARAQQLSDLWHEAAGGKLWHMHDHPTKPGHQVAVDMAAATLSIGKPQFDVDRHDDHLAWRYRVDAHFAVRDESWRVITGISS